MENLNLNSLRVFAVSARHGSFQRAADALHISHGAVSQRIKQLETELGIILFDRKPRGVELTPKGQTYYLAVEEALRILATATFELEKSSSQIRLHIGASTASKWLMPRMDSFGVQCPKIALETEIHHSVLQRNLGRNELALWPGRSPARKTAHHVEALCELRIVAVCSPNLLRPDWPMDTDTLLSLPLLQDANRRWESLIDLTKHKGPHSILNFGQSALALDAAIHGHGVALAPTFLIEEDLKSRRLVEIWRHPDASGEFLFLSWAKRHSHESSIKQTASWILGEFGQTLDPPSNQ